MNKILITNYLLQLNPTTNYVTLQQIHQELYHWKIAKFKYNIYTIDKLR